MIRCTRNLLLILVVALALAGCMPTAPQTRGSQAAGLVPANIAVAAGSPTIVVGAIVYCSEIS